MSEVKAKQLPQYIASIIAAIGAFQLGILLGWSNVVQEEIEAGEYRFPCSKEEFSWISSAFVLGAMVVCVPAGYLINLIGRKGTMIVMCLPFLWGWLLLIFAQDIKWMYAGRFLLGIAGGSYGVSVPVYTGEIAQKEIRGQLGTIYMFMIVIGILYIWTIGAFLKTLEISSISIIFPIVMAVFMFCMPESPIYLVKKNKLEAASKSFAWLRGKDYDTKHEIDDIKSSEAEDNISLREAFRRPATKRAFVISAMLMVLQQFCGINVVTFYSTEIFRISNVGLDPKYSTILLGIVKVLSAFSALMLMDRWGRRTLLLLSGSFLAICSFGLSAYFLIKEYDPIISDQLGWLPITSAAIFVIFFTIGYGPIPWLTVGEIFPVDVKGTAGSISVCINWLCTFIVTKTFVNLKDLLGIGGTFLLFTALTAVGVIFVWCIVIETKGKSLNEIQAKLDSPKKTQTVQIAALTL